MGLPHYPTSSKLGPFRIETHGFGGLITHFKKPHITAFSCYMPGLYIFGVDMCRLVMTFAIASIEFDLSRRSAIAAEPLEVTLGKSNVAVSGKSPMCNVYIIYLLG